MQNAASFADLLRHGPVPPRILPIVLLAWTLPLAAEPRSIGLNLMAIEDGDTLLVAIDGVEQRVQLADIDTPEDADNPKLQRDQARTGLPRERLVALGTAATAHVAGLLAEPRGWSLTLSPNRRDRYGRLEVEITGPADQSLSHQLVIDGFARCLCDDCCGALERQAIDAGRGLWAAPTRADALQWAEKEAE